MELYMNEETTDGLASAMFGSFTDMLDYEEKGSMISEQFGKDEEETIDNDQARTITGDEQLNRKYIRHDKDFNSFEIGEGSNKIRVNGCYSGAYKGKVTSKLIELTGIIGEVEYIDSETFEITRKTEVIKVTRKDVMVDIIRRDHKLFLRFRKGSWVEIGGKAKYETEAEVLLPSNKIAGFKKVFMCYLEYNKSFQSSLERVASNSVRYY